MEVDLKIGKTQVSGRGSGQLISPECAYVARGSALALEPLSCPCSWFINWRQRLYLHTRRSPMAYPKIHEAPTTPSDHFVPILGIVYG